MMSNSTDFILKNLGKKNAVQNNEHSLDEIVPIEPKMTPASKQPSMSAVLTNCLTKNDELNLIPPA